MSVAAPHTANAQSSDARKQDAPTIATEQVGAYEATGVGGLALSGGVAGLVLGRRGDAEDEGDEDEGDEDEGEAMNIGGVAVATDSALGTTLDKLRRRANADPSHGAIARADAAGPGGATMDALRRRAVDGEAGAGGSRGSTGRASAGPVPRARPATFISYESGPSRADSPRQDDAETLGGAASVASATDTKAARWHPHGRFAWWVKWRTDGRSGWITQKVTNTYAERTRTARRSPMRPPAPSPRTTSHGPYPRAARSRRPPAPRTTCGSASAWARARAARGA